MKMTSRRPCVLCAYMGRNEVFCNVIGLVNWFCESRYEFTSANIADVDPKCQRGMRDELLYQRSATGVGPMDIFLALLSVYRQRMSLFY